MGCFQSKATDDPTIGAVGANSNGGIGVRGSVSAKSQVGRSRRVDDQRGAKFVLLGDMGTGKVSFASFPCISFSWGCCFLKKHSSKTPHFEQIQLTQQFNFWLQTSVATRFTRNTFSTEHAPTIGAAFQMQRLAVGDRNVKMEL